MRIASLSFSWNLVGAESRISKQSAEGDWRQRSELCKMFEDVWRLVWRDMFTEACGKNDDQFSWYNKHYSKHK